VEKTGLHGVPSMEKGIKNGTTNIRVSNKNQSIKYPHWIFSFGGYFILNY
jgi:hypothetical protein